MSVNLKYQVKYISNSCSDTDELLNKPHQSVAESLYDLLENHSEIVHPVIGLEGSWGSGKSQVISILQKLIRDKGKESKYVFFTYDIWSAQEDLTRRSFLDNVLSKAKEDDRHFKTAQLKEDYNKLNATTTIRSTKSFPLVRLFFACLLLIPVMLFIVNAVENYFGYQQDAAWTYDKLKGFLSLIFAAVSLLLFIVAYFEERKTVYSDVETKNKSHWGKFQIIIGRLFYIFKAKEIEKTDLETIIKDEPSISRFQNFFDHVHENLNDNTTLVIVFDNMDRLCDSQKLMSTWSLLHSFFSEKKYDGKVWALVPYAKQQLSELMTNEPGKADKTTEFLNKTFFTSFHIPEPIMGSWKNFLDKKLNDAFTPELDADEKNIVALIFSRSRSGQVIRPRDIISFVNRLVSIYSQHHFEDVPLKYVALYAQYEEIFSNSPVEAILSFKGFDSLASLVGKDNLSGWLSSIYYNLPSSTALEVVFDREIQSFLQCDYEVMGNKDEVLEAYAKLSNNQHFRHHIEEFFNKDVKLEDFKLENIFYLLIQRNVSTATQQRIYNLVYDQRDKLFDQLRQYEPWMEPVFLVYDSMITNKLIEYLLEASSSSFDSYYMTVVPLLKLQASQNSIKVLVPHKNVESAKEMMEYFDFLKSENATTLYAKARIFIHSSKLLEYMRESVTGNILFGNNVDSMYELLTLMKANDEDLKPINKVIQNASINLVGQHHKEIERIYKVYNIVTDNKNNVPPYTLSDVNAHKFLDIPEFFACTLVQLNSRHNKNEINNCIAGNIMPDELAVSDVLSDYFSFNNLLRITLFSDNDMLKKICLCTAKNGISSLDGVDEVLKQTDLVINAIFAESPEPFLNYLDLQLEKVLQLAEKYNYLNINDYWRNTINKDNISNHIIYKIIKDRWLNEISEFDSNTWSAVLSGSNAAISETILRLKQIEMLPSDFWKTISAEVVGKTFIPYIAEKKSLDENLFLSWKHEAKKAVLAKLANDTMDAIENPKRIEERRFVQFVELLLANSERAKDNSRVNAIFDDYVSDYLMKDCYEEIAQFLSENQNEVAEYALKLDGDRKELFAEKLENLFAHIDEKGEAACSIVKLIDLIKPKK